MNPRGSSPTITAVRHSLESPQLASVLTQLALGVAFSASLLRDLIGLPGLRGAVFALVVIAALSLVARRRTLGWHGLLPLSILIFVAWCALSIAWSGYTVLSLVGVGAQLTWAFLAIYIALVRDTIQILRATGNVLRVLLGVSLGLEVLSGLLLDMPFRFLGIEGNIASLGPIQGIFGSRNALGLIALVAAVTFSIELRSRSVTRNVGIASLVLTGVMLLLTRSPVIVVVALFVAIAALALYWLRRTRVEIRWRLQLGLAGATVVVGVIALVARSRILALLNAGSEFEVRYTLWREMWRLTGLHPLEGWGWVGTWPQSVTPYGWLDFVTKHNQTSGLNAFIDVYLQVGLVGFILFLALVTLAFVRSWLLASNKRPLVYVWPALIVVILLVISTAESTVLTGFGWMLLVVCAVKAAQGMSWRTALARHPHQNHDHD
ncbi:O-antigen ligase family protein [Glaciibacter psychrotolerans]|uniref:O-antigen ligase n=1 Tax=Glaciibacter psychrotolerans TaxID=670054 RepID=A0A7Z0EET0_9MICO|nr:O-antigen ligase family protein [Leifsonia psychrotolerans]NYJ20231.1 O-antigen ligase [Leifsonia psychrotolerans]